MSVAEAFGLTKRERWNGAFYQYTMSAYDMLRMTKKFERSIRALSDLRSMKPGELKSRYEQVVALQKLTPNNYISESFIREFALECTLRVLKVQMRTLKEDASVSDAVLRNLERTPEERWNLLPDYMKWHYRHRARKNGADIDDAGQIVMPVLPKPSPYIGLERSSSPYVG